DPEAEFKRYLRQASDDDEPAEPVSLALVSDITSWEIIPTEFGLGEIHVLTRADGTVKRFSTLRELMYWPGRADLMVLYGLVLDKYKTERATCIGLGLCMDLRTLITTREERDPSIIWDDQDQWQIHSWRFYALPAIHILETEAGDIMYMFVDKKYPLTPKTIQWMLNHGIKIDRDPSGLMSQMIVYDGFFSHLALLGTLGGLVLFTVLDLFHKDSTKPSRGDSKMFIMLQDPNDAVDTSCYSTLNPHTALMTIYY
nr:hypothetical protein [Tanacetum cinerariifolium]